MSAQHNEPLSDDVIEFITDALEAQDVDRLENILSTLPPRYGPVPVALVWLPDRFRTAFLKFRYVGILALPCGSIEPLLPHRCNLLANAILGVDDVDKMARFVRLIVQHMPQLVATMTDISAHELNAGSLFHAELSPLVSLILRAQRGTFEPGSVMRNTFDFLIASGADMTHHSPTNCFKSPDVAVWAAITRNPAILCAVLGTGKVNVVHLAEDIQLYATEKLQEMQLHEGVIFRPYDKYIMQALIGSAMIIMCHYSAMGARVISTLKTITDGIFFSNVPGAFDLIKRFLPGHVIPLREKCRAAIRQLLIESGAASATGSLQNALALLPLPESQKRYLSTESAVDGSVIASELRMRLTKASHKMEQGAVQYADCFFSEDTFFDNIGEHQLDYVEGIYQFPPMMVDLESDSSNDDDNEEDVCDNCN